MTLLIAGWSLTGCGGVSGSGGDEASPGVTIAPATATVAENGGTASFAVALTTAPNEVVVMDVSSSDTAEATVNRDSLTFTSENWSLPQPVTITGQDDHRVDGDTGIDVLLQVNGGATLDSSGYAAMAAEPLGSVRVTVLDDDTAGVAVEPTALAVSEGGANLSQSFQVKLDTVPDGEVVIAVQNDNPEMVTTGPERLVFGPENWSEAQAVTVTGLDNLLIDGSRTAQVRLEIDDAATLDSTGYAFLEPIAVKVEVADNDVANFTVSPTALTVSDTSPTSATFDVWLETQPNADVLLDVKSSNTAQATVDKPQLVFTSGNYSQRQKVTVRAVVDQVADGHQFVDVGVQVSAATTAGSGYQDLAREPAKIVAVTVADGDIRGLRLSQRNLQVDEVGPRSTDSFTVALSSNPQGRVAVSVVSRDSGEVLVNGQPRDTLVFDATNWNRAQAVTVSGVNDFSFDGSQSVTVDVQVDAAGTDDSTGYVGQKTDVTVAVIDNGF